MKLDILIKSLETAKNTNEFSSETNDIFKRGIKLIEAGRKHAFVGAIVLAAAYEDQKHGAQAMFGNKLLYPKMTLQELKKLAESSKSNTQNPTMFGSEKPQLTTDEFILKLADKSNELLNNDIYVNPIAFPEVARIIALYFQNDTPKLSI